MSGGCQANDGEGGGGTPAAVMSVTASEASPRTRKHIDTTPGRGYARVFGMWNAAGRMGAVAIHTPTKLANPSVEMFRTRESGSINTATCSRGVALMRARVFSHCAQARDGAMGRYKGGHDDCPARKPDRRPRCYCIQGLNGVRTVLATKARVHAIQSDDRLRKGGLERARE